MARMHLWVLFGMLGLLTTTDSRLISSRISQEQIKLFSNKTDVSKSLMRFALKRVRALRDLSGVSLEKEILVDVKYHGGESIRHGVKETVPRYQRMVVYDDETSQYRIVRGEVEQVVRKEKVVENSTTLSLKFEASGSVQQDVDLVISEDMDGKMAVSKFTLTFGIQEEGSNLKPQWEYLFDDNMVLSRKENPILKVMSVNIWNFNHWKERQSLLQDTLIETLPDIIGFQEVRSKKACKSKCKRQNRNQAADIARILPGFQYVFRGAMMFEQDEELHQEGLAIFSRFPILDTSYKKLSRDPSDSGDFHQRLCLRALVSTPIGKVNFFVTHLSLSEKARERTMEEVAEYVNSFPEPSVIVGDFNSVIHKELPDWPQYHGFQDVWKEIYPSAEGLTFSSWLPRSRIDYIFASKQLKTLEVTIEGKDSKPSDLPPIGGVYNMKGVLFPSDHMFPCATLTRST
mmetsp:Transcript_5265/g.7751  ORF Transcript_5265/g.7751 Transcript_5265/m.7751 type:complete len:459 (+) Transcript_5265:40-1416(+)